ncbi:MAG: glycosyltransferase family 4 protein [Deltaproteobacteria bacterium]|nr:glycosyltransferase family 4 protein [Deltaproteobacteria bacterium]
MRVGVDLTALLPEPTGVDVSLKGLVRALAAVDDATRYTLFVNYEDRHLFDDALGRNFAIAPLCLRPRPARLAFQQMLLPAMAVALGLDVLHSPSFIMPMIRGRQRHVLTIHDMTSFSLPEYHIPLRRSASYRTAVSASIRRADLVTTPSQFVREDILRHVPDLAPNRIRVVPWGVGNEFRPRPEAEARHALAHLGLPWPYVLFVGAIQPRKNLAGLLEAYRRLVASGDVAEHLVLAGPLGWDYTATLATFDTPALAGRVHLTGYVRSTDLPWLYAGARLFAYLSFEEGFGFPPLEAMACGVPTIASRSSALTENLEGAAELVPADAPDVLVAAMRRLLSDDHERDRLRSLGLARAARFRWHEAAEHMRACYVELAEGREP